ncbi:sigma 54-interacting transcriptional regulator [Desulfovibrio porci]|uniref:sigma 54-interacting transcriptional regulator n=1 Tax=Desulfovibrio porci TaxID=2605782 RepID=UPI003A8DE03E
MSTRATTRAARHAALRACPGLAETAACLARLAGTVAGAAFCGVFLLDYTSTELVLRAAWHGDKGLSTPEGLSLPLDGDDPVCFSLQTGEPYTTRPDERSRLFPSLALLGPVRPAARLTALPLTAARNISLGGVLLGFAGPDARPEQYDDAALLCDVGALLLESHLQRQKERLLLHSLNEDITRLENSARTLRTAESLFLGESPAALRVREWIARAAPTDIPVLITGETGTGKELAASALHAASLRHAAPFVKINCAALPGQLLESELFGHRKGAFSGADCDRPGLLRSADGGTVLLDEIGEMPSELQAKLLRVLQDRQVRPVGDTHPRAVDIRIVASTNRNMEEALASGAFRPDLYHRLAGLRIHIPPLRERPEDIPLLARHFLVQIGEAVRRPGLSLTPESLRLLCAASYPGNVRQLCNRIQTAAVMADPATGHLTPEAFAGLEASPADGTEPEAAGLTHSLRLLEEKLIAQAMARCSGNVAEAAKELRLPRSTLVSKLKKWPR